MIYIGKNQIGPKLKPFIIAEVGSNWKSIDDCMASIEAAKRAGADAVKFQAYTFQALYGLGKEHIPRSYQKEYELPMDWLAKLKNKCDQVGIEFMCTGFDPDTMKNIDQFVNCHKIASSDLNYKALLEMAVRLRKPLFISTGAATDGDVRDAMIHLKDLQVILMYCVAAYPAKAVNMFVMDRLKEYSDYVGFSDHTQDYAYIPLSAVKNHGAVAIEKHFNILSDSTPDSGHSLNELQFTSMVDLITGKRSVKIIPHASESDMTSKHKRRIIATRDIKEGEKFKLNENFGVYRSLNKALNAHTADMADEIDGSACKASIKASEAITSDHY